MDKPVICTIVAKNYLAQARCLTDSFLRNHPDGQVFVLVIDEFDGYFDPAEERFSTVRLKKIGIPDLQTMIYRYTVLELSTAVKPFFLEYLFRQFDCQKLCYFDPDICFYKPIDQIWNLLDSYGIVLTPHLLDFLEDEFWPNELDILRSGSYNLGFIGLSEHPDLTRFLRWWQRKVTRHCVVAIQEGLFVDQKWMDLAPSLFRSVHIHQDPGCNVAYWNLKNRHVRCQGGEYTVNGVPLKFFHFSGFSPGRMNALSKHQDRFTLHDLPNLRPLFEAYRDSLVAHGHGDVQQWPYTHNYHEASGMRIPDVARTMWEDWKSRGRGVDSPDSASEADPMGAFLSWVNEPIDGDSRLPLTRLALAVYRQRPDLQQVFPDVLGKDRRQYVRWFLSRAEAELELDEFFVQPIREPQSGPATAHRIHNIPTQLYMGFTNLLFRIGAGEWLEQTLGKRRVDRIRRVFLRSNGPAPPSTPTPAVATDLLKRSPMGLNVVGYVCDETGVGEVARASMRALHEEGFPVAYTRVSSHAARKGDRSVLHMSEGHPYAFNWLHVNADEVKNAHQELGPAFFAGKYNIAYWAWELDPFPDEWLDRFQYFDEIWVGSSFVQRVLAPVSPIPVIVIGAPVERPADPGIARRQLGVPEDKFLFLFVFDMLSYIDRKNPFGVIEAYRRAFGPNSPDTELIIKVTNLDRFPQHSERLREAVESVSGTLIDRYLDREMLDGLFYTADAYISLHRSEGFGLTIAEAMRLGTPTIATAYSSTEDYLNTTNGYPVGYRLVELEEDCGPYRKGGLWADPDLDQAATQMLRVVENPDEAVRKGQRAALDMERKYGSAVVAQRIIERVKRASSWLHQEP